MHDLAVVIVSIPGDVSWLRPCVASVRASASDLDVDVVVVENDGRGAAADAIEGLARIVTCANHGFAHGNNRALADIAARHVLFLNPDTEVVAGRLETLVRRMDADPSVGVLGARQVLPDGTTFPTARRFPTALRALGEALGAERLPARVARALRERELDMDRYAEPMDCDWLSGSFLLVRAEALAGAGWFDERFFLYSEETDLCLRVRRAGWRVAYDPAVTIVHHMHAGADVDVRMAVQFLQSRVLYARKNLPPVHRGLYLAALAAGVVRRRRHVRTSLAALAGRAPHPFEPPPPAAVRPPAATVPGRFR